MLTLAPRGVALVSSWLAGQPIGAERAEGMLARRLLDAGLVHPDPPPRERRADEVTIVVPVYGYGNELERCLAALSGDSPVIVVDDGSPDGAALAEVAARSGAQYARHRENRGAAAARNTGLELTTTPFVAFVDSDCVPPPEFPDRLLDHLADPALGLVAPRIVSSGEHAGRIAAYERCRSPLDMGPTSSLVRPFAWVWYVPSAAMVARREALGRGFDEALTLGEDVDLVWRLHDAGWQVRYEPRVRVVHHDRVKPSAWYRRRVAYNESVAPLIQRHPERLPTLFVSPPAAVGWSAALSGAWPALVVLSALRAARLHRSVAGRLPGAAGWAVRVSGQATVQEGRDLGRALAGPWAPFAIALAVLRVGRDLGVAHRVAGLLAALVVTDWVTDRPSLDPVSYAALRIADESARGVGIWLACARARDFRALLPRRPPPVIRR